MRTILLAAIALAAAAPAAHADPTPYQAAASAPYGYADTQLDATHLRITFTGNEDTSRAAVEAYVLYRAAQVTLMRGYDHFAVLNHSVDALREMQPVGPPLPPIAPRRYRESVRYTATSDIEMRRGEKAAYAGAVYDAREVEANLVWRISHHF